jgi:hypothetical protein
LEQLQFAFVYVEEFHARAIASPVVQEVMDFLSRIVQTRGDDPMQNKKDLIPRPMRECASKLLKKLLLSANPPIEPLRFRESTMEGYVLRANMLAMNNKELETLRRLWKEHNSKPERLRALQECYPTKSPEELKNWLHKKFTPAQIAENLVAQQYDSAVSPESAPGPSPEHAPERPSIRHYLRQARRKLGIDALQETSTSLEPPAHFVSL